MDLRINFVFQNLITKATSLLSLKDVQIDLPFDQDWLEVVKAVCAIARTVGSLQQK